MNKQVNDRPAHVEEEPPPFGRSWTTLYAVVLINLVLLIVLFYAFTKFFE